MNFPGKKNNKIYKVSNLFQMFRSSPNLGQTMGQARRNLALGLFYSLAFNQSLRTGLRHFSLIPTRLQCLTIRQPSNCQFTYYIRGERWSRLERLLLHRINLSSDFGQHSIELPMFLQAIHSGTSSQNGLDFSHLPQVSQVISQRQKSNDSGWNDEFDVNR